MLAKSQAKLHQFEVKQDLKRLLKERSVSNLTDSDKAKLDPQIKEAQEYLQTNKQILPSHGKRKTYAS